MSRPVEIRPPELARPLGFAHGMVAEGRVLAVAGQIGIKADGKLVGDDFVAQFAQTLDNVLAVVRAAGGEPTSVFQMTVFVLDVAEYRAAVRPLRPVWLERFGRYYPAMALVGVAGLVEPGAKVEIMALASLGPAPAPPVSTPPLGLGRPFECLADPPGRPRARASVRRIFGDLSTDNRRCRPARGGLLGTLRALCCPERPPRRFGP
ncbi:MAG: RidA family protein [Polyangiaceae bacterium]|nr:RidA family protein [Polyangiaceae bacterium]